MISASARNNAHCLCAFKDGDTYHPTTGRQATRRLGWFLRLLPARRIDGDATKRLGIATLVAMMKAYGAELER